MNPLTSTHVRCGPRDVDRGVELYFQMTLKLKFVAYCNIWKLSVNVEKTKIVIFGKSKWKGKQIFKYDGKIITVEDSFKYLGVILNYNGSFVKHKKHVIDQSQKAMFAHLRRSRQLDLPIDLQLELFDSLIMPILLYGCEI